MNLTALRLKKGKAQLSTNVHQAENPRVVQSVHGVAGTGHVMLSQPGWARDIQQV
jgi:hypothetical protein